MALQGSIPITTLERAISTDVVTAQDLINRSVAEVVRVWTARRYTGSTSPYTIDHVASGLHLTVSAGTLYLKTGLLAQDVASNPPDVPAPGTFDSDYRFGLNLADAALSDPWDTTDKWWLLQARVVRDTALSEKRDIYNPTLGTFALSGTDLDKRYESIVETAWKAGTSTTIPTADTGYAPIAALWRPSGGGTITTVDIIQLATQFEDLCNHLSNDGIAKRTSAMLQPAYDSGSGYGQAYDEMVFNFAGEINGRKLYAMCEGGGGLGAQLRSAAYLDPSDSALHAVSGVWWYIYLCNPNDTIPSNSLYGVRVENRGCIVCSRVPPTDYGTNSATIDVPNPIGGTVSAGRALFVGCFRANGTGNDIDFINVTESGEGIVDRQSNILGSYLQQSNNFGNSLSPVALATAGASGTELVPYGCHLKCQSRVFRLDTASVAIVVGAEIGMTNDVFTTRDALACSCRSIHDQWHWLCPRDGNLTVTINSDTYNLNWVATASFPSDGGNNEFTFDLVGIRLI